MIGFHFSSNQCGGLKKMDKESNKKSEECIDLVGGWRLIHCDVKDTESYLGRFILKTSTNRKKWEELTIPELTFFRG
jgi:hypothetical protein